MAQQKSVMRAVEDVTLTDVKTYMLTPLLTVRHRFTVSHHGLPFEVSFDKLEDAEKFFRVELQARNGPGPDIGSTGACLTRCSTGRICR